MKEYPGENLSVLRQLFSALVYDSTFRKESLRRSRLRGGGKNNTGSLDKQKLQHIKIVNFLPVEHSKLGGK